MAGQYGNKYMAKVKIKMHLLTNDGKKTSKESHLPIISGHLRNKKSFLQS